MNILLRILALIRKEFIAIFKDPRSRFVVLVPPILQMIIFGYAGTFDLNNVPYVLVDQSHSSESARLIGRMNGSGIFTCVATAGNIQQAKPMLDSRQTLLIIQIPQHFQRDISTAQTAQIQVIADGRNSNTAALAIGYLTEILNEFNANVMATHSGGAPPPAVLLIRSWFNPDLLSRWQIVPAMIGLITMVAVVILTAMSVAREREQGTFDQLLVTPFTPLEIMAGKSIPPIMVGLAQSAVIFCIVRYWFAVPYYGTAAAIILTFLIFIIAAAGLGLLVSSISSTMQQALLGTFVLVMPCGLLSGLATPVSNMPRPVQDITLIDPLRYDVQAVREAFLQGANVHQLLPELIPMAIIATVSLLTASWLFRRIS